MTAHKMLLTPVDPDCTTVDSDRLEEILLDMGFIGPPIPLEKETIHPVGEHFLQLVTFLGCSPRIELDPPDTAAELEAASREGSFCHVSLLGTDQELQFRADDRTPAPRCPRCRQPLTDWRCLIRIWRKQPDATGWTCAGCGYRGRLTELNFSKSAGFGRIFLEMRGIHPGEAVAGEALLASLRSLTGCEWRTLYVRE
jgi:hypothetical protein